MNIHTEKVLGYELFTFLIRISPTADENISLNLKYKCKDDIYLLRSHYNVRCQCYDNYLLSLIVSIVIMIINSLLIFQLFYIVLFLLSNFYFPFSSSVMNIFVLSFCK